MRTVLLSLLGFAVGALAGASQEAAIDAAKLDRIRKMKPEERRRLLEVVRKIQRLPEEERVRLRENLQKFRKLDREEQARLRLKAKNLGKERRNTYRDLIMTFNRSLTPKARRVLQGFPRGLFFVWIQRDRPEDFARLQGLSPDDRKDLYRNLYVDFVRALEARLRQHVRKHRCVSASQFQQVRGPDGVVRWNRWQDLVRVCRTQQMHERRRRPRRWH